MLVALTMFVCADPRAYEGPREVVSTQAEIDRPALLDVEPKPPEIIRAPLEGDSPAAAEELPERTGFFSKGPRLPGTGPPEERASVRRWSGRRLLIAGGVFAGTGFVMSSIVLGAWFRPCSEFCEPYGAIFTSIAAPVPWLLGIGMLGGGMQHRSKMIAARAIADGRAVKKPRRGLFGAGLAMTIIGAGSIVGTWWAPGINMLAQLGGGPLAVAGALMAGHARGRRLALREQVTVMPLVTRTTTMLSLGMRW